jgi:DNA-binding transcriptional MerR regulator
LVDVPSVAEGHGADEGRAESGGRVFTARDAEELAGMTYRQLNDWDARGAVPGERAGNAGWRKFSPRDLFAIMVCSEIRRRFGVPVESLRFVMRCMVQNDGRDHLRAAIDLMQLGLSVYLLTDFKETFVMDSDLEFLDMMRIGYFRMDVPCAYIFIRLNDIVNRMFTATKTPELKPNNRVYFLKEVAQAEITACTPTEMKVLQLLRREDCDRVTVLFKYGEPNRIEVEGDVSLEELKETAEAVGIKKESEFETITVTRHAGKATRVKRKIPSPVRQEDNERVFFGGTLFTKRKKK